MKFAFILSQAWVATESYYGTVAGAKSFIFKIIKKYKNMENYFHTLVWRPDIDGLPRSFPYERQEDLLDSEEPAHAQMQHLIMYILLRNPGFNNLESLV